MNKLTRKIRNKGYTLPEFCESIGFSLRWFRTHEASDTPQHDKIVEHIEQMENKVSFDASPTLNNINTDLMVNRCREQMEDKK